MPHPVPWLPGTFIKVTLHTHGLTDVPKADLISDRAHLGTFAHRVVSPSILFIELGRGIPGRSTLCSGPNSFGSHHNDMVSGFCLMGIGAGGAMKCVLRGGVARGAANPDSKMFCGVREGSVSINK